MTADTGENTTVCAVVVTYNRCELLRECLQALLAQAHPVTKIVVVDNASSDRTSAMLAAEFGGRIELLRLALNEGGAGGFHAGMKHAQALGEFAWLWLLDDDTIVQRDSLERLLHAAERLSEAGDPPMLLASKVVWTDGSLHAMNQCFVKYADNVRAVVAAERATLSLRTASFVSLLVRRSAVEQYGLPFADYFIWGDDMEYTARILRRDFGVLVPDSWVLHKTATNHTARDAAPAKFYYHVRNSLWMLTRSDAWSAKERLMLFAKLTAFAGSYLQRAGFSRDSVSAVAKAIKDAAVTRPRN